MTYSPVHIANEFLLRGKKDEIPVSPMKIQKLMYLAHGYYLHLTGNPLIDEQFEAWKFGPVLASIYHKCKKFDRRGIQGILTSHEKKTELDDNANTVISFVWETYGKYDPMVLSRWTHERGGPWDKTDLDERIDNKLIEAYFNSAIARVKGASSE